jgi:hypothetical protein
VDTPTPGLDGLDGLDAEQPLAERIEAGLVRLDDAELSEHPAAYEQMDEAVRAELQALDRLSGDPDG